MKINYFRTRSFLLILPLTIWLVPALNAQNANLQWVQRYSYCTTCVQQINEAQKVAIDTKGSVYVGGYSQQVDNDMNWAVVKYNSSGSLLWEARYAGAAGGFDALYDMRVDYSTGDVYATGKSIENGSSSSVITTVKYNRNGVQQWVAHYNGFASVAYAIEIDSQGNCYVAGQSSEVGYPAVTIKYNTSGSQQWVAKYNSAGGQGVALDSSGNVYVVGSTQISGDPYEHLLTIKYNSQGVEQWHNVYGSDSAPSGITVDSLANVYVTGASLSAGYSHGFLTLKYDTSGNQIWAATYEGLGNGQDEARAIAYDPGTNTVIVTGSSFNSSTTATYLTIKYNVISGAAIWATPYIGPVNFDGANAIALDTLGNTYVTGGSLGSGTGYDYATVKYNRNGVQQWAVRYDGGFGDDYANSIAVGPSGNVYVTGASGNGVDDDYATVKYSQN